MSEKEQEAPAQSGDETQEAAAPTPAEAVSSQPEVAPADEPAISEPEPEVAPKAAPAPEQPAPTPRRGGWFTLFIALLALLLVLGLGAVAALYVKERGEDAAQVTTRLERLEAAAMGRNDDLGALSERLENRIDKAVQPLRQGARTRDDQLRSLAATLESQRQELATLSATDLEDWNLAEARYLLRLANQRLLMAGDVPAAQALLASADGVLADVDDPALHATRRAIASNLAALRAVPSVDVDGLYLRVNALADQVDQLAIFRLPDAPVGESVGETEDWQDRLERGYQAGLDKLSSYIVIRRREVPYEALMDPQWEALVRQNLRMLLEQAQAALLSGNQVLFRESLQRAARWTQEFFVADAAATEALARELNRLSDAVVQVELPDISESLRQLDNVLDARRDG